MDLVAEDLSVGLSGRKVIDAVDMRLAPGEVVGLIGPNGAGKSTLIRALAGQLPASGTIRFGGRAVASLPRGERARLLAYLPQNRIVGWPLSVADVVGLGRLPWLGFGRAPGAADEALCREAMALTDVAHLAARRATELSGGEQARVLAARAIAQDTPVLLADEPVSGLDPAHQMTMMMAFRRLAAHGRAVLVSLHDLTLAARWCDRVVVLAEGRVAAAGRPGEIVDAALLSHVFGITAHIDRDACGLVVAPVGLAGQAEPVGPARQVRP